MSASIVIPYVAPSELTPDVLRHLVYPRLDVTYYWSDHWDPEFYVALARAGFISTCFDHPQAGPILLSELQRSYAVLDWSNLHCSRNLRALLRSDHLDREGIELRTGPCCDRVLERLAAYHGERSWLRAPYRALVRKLAARGSPRFAMLGVELWSRERDALIAGELGYAIGRTYTSLSGFCSRGERRWRHSGTLQMFLLAEALRRRRYAFWNLGHVGMPYKRALGARPTPRTAFLERWLPAIDAEPDEPLADGR